MTSLESISFEIIRQRNRTIERKIVETIERLLGRVPTNDEVARNGKHIVLTHANEEHYLWDGFRLFTIRNHKTGLGFDVETCV